MVQLAWVHEPTPRRTYRGTTSLCLRPCRTAAVRPAPWHARGRSVHEPALEERSSRLFERLADPAVQIDLVVERAEGRCDRLLLGEGRDLRPVRLNPRWGCVEDLRARSAGDELAVEVWRQEEPVEEVRVQHIGTEYFDLTHPLVVKVAATIMRDARGDTENLPTRRLTRHNNENVTRCQIVLSGVGTRVLLECRRLETKAAIVAKVSNVDDDRPARELFAE